MYLAFGDGVRSPSCFVSSAEWKLDFMTDKQLDCICGSLFVCRSIDDLLCMCLLQSVSEYSACMRKKSEKIMILTVVVS